MAEISPAGWQEVGSNHARQGRLLAVQGGGEGIWSSVGATASHLKVTGVGTANATIAAGGCYVDAGTGQGLYACYNDANVNVAIPAQGAGSARTDLIVARVYDTNFGDGGPDRWVLERIDGTATAPLAPSAPSRCYVLAEVTVNASGTTIASISDKRKAFTAFNGTLVVRNSSGNTSSNLAEFQNSSGSVLSAINYLGQFTGTVLSASNLIPVAASLEYMGTTLPTGWLWQDGSAVSRTTYAALFAEIGTTYGNGNGSTTFNLPDRRGRVGVGAGTGSGLSARALAATGGAENAIVVTHNHSHNHSSSMGTESADHAHTVASHSHGGVVTSVGDHSHAALATTRSIYSAGGSSAGLYALDYNTPTTGAGAHNHGIPAEAPGTGGRNAAHVHSLTINADATSAGSSGTGANMPPFLVCNYIIKY